MNSTASRVLSRRGDAPRVAARRIAGVCMPGRAYLCVSRREATRAAGRVHALCGLLVESVERRATSLVCGPLSGPLVETSKTGICHRSNQAKRKLAGEDTAPHQTCPHQTLLVQYCQGSLSGPGPCHQTGPHQTEFHAAACQRDDPAWSRGVPAGTRSCLPIAGPWTTAPCLP